VLTRFSPYRANNSMLLSVGDAHSCVCSYRAAAARCIVLLAPKTGGTVGAMSKSISMTATGVYALRRVEEMNCIHSKSIYAA
jgi:hypothetical protein